MKKVLVVSCYFQKNYGSALQALATQMALDKLNIENKTVCYDGLEKAIKSEKYKYYAKKMLNMNVVSGKIGYVKMRLLKKIPFSSLGRNLKARDVAIKKFEKRFRLTKSINSFQELTELAHDYDAVLLGSDQLWLPSNLDAGYYTLNWVPEGVTRITYATSFGLSKLPQSYYPMVAAFIGKIDQLSVREQTGVKIIEDVCGRKAELVCDPTILFTGEEWRTAVAKKTSEVGKYIFCYFLGDNPEQRAFVKRLKAETGYKIVAILHLNVYVKSDRHFADEEIYEADSADFLNLIRNAEYVCTDSFHATVFSILNEKRFFTFRRFKESYSLSTNSRLDTLLNQLSLQRRILTGQEDVAEMARSAIMYDDVNQKIADMRQHGWDYLEKALEKV